jgi:hypothetical protein
MIRSVEFDAAQRARQTSYGRYRLTPRDAYVLLSAPIRGLGRPERRRRDGVTRASWMMMCDENLSNVVERLLQRGFLALRVGEGPIYADLTAEGRAALEAGRIKSLR